ncbi:alpha/beta hydrolase, partial [Pseudomonas gessardii]|nr:alpha/beta hydrolase [Pseudomonas gessardii]
MNLPSRPHPETFHEPAADNYPIGGFTWRHIRTDIERPVVII